MITNAQYAITSTATEVATSTVGHKNVYLHVLGNKSVYLGSSSAVTSTTGLLLDKTAGVVMIRLAAGDKLFACTNGADTDTISVLIGE